MTITWTQGQPLPQPQEIARYGLMAGTDCSVLKEDATAISVPLGLVSTESWCVPTRGTGYPVPVIVTVHPQNLVPGNYNTTIQVIPDYIHRCGILELPVQLTVLASAPLPAAVKKIQPYLA